MEEDRNAADRDDLVISESDAPPNRGRSLVDALYRAARFEGLEEPSCEDWRRIITDSSSVEWILDWREGVSNIIDGIAEHGGNELIDELIDRSLSEGSRYLYIALAPYASREMRAKYSHYFEADDAYRAAFEDRLPDDD